MLADDAERERRAAVPISDFVFGAPRDFDVASDAVAYFTVGTSEEAHRGVIIDANAAALELFGRQRNEFVGKNHAIILPPVLGVAHQSMITRFARDGVARVTQSSRLLLCASRDGTLVPIVADIRSMDGCLGFACERVEVKQSFVWFGGEGEVRIGSQKVVVRCGDDAFHETTLQGWVVDAASASALSVLGTSAEDVHRKRVSMAHFLPGGVAPLIAAFRHRREERDEQLRRQVAGTIERVRHGVSSSSATGFGADDVELDVTLMVPTDIDLISDSPVADQSIHVKARLQTMHFPGLGRPIHMLMFSRVASAAVARRPRRQGHSIAAAEGVAKESAKGSIATSHSSDASVIPTPLRASVVSAKSGLEPTLLRMRRSLLVVVAAIFLLNIAVGYLLPVPTEQA